MTVIQPTSGDGVSILAPHTRLRGHVTDGGPEALTVELEQTPIRQPFRFPAGSEVAVEWTDPSGVMQLSATVGDAHEHPHPTLVLRLVGLAEPVKRRFHSRVQVELPASAWTLAQPTRRVAGETVDLSTGGAQLRLPDLAPLAASVELWIALPGGPLHVSAGVRWRREPGLVGVEFERISPEEQARLVEFLRGLR